MLLHYNIIITIILGAIAQVGVYFGQQTAPVVFDSLTCSGKENKLLECTFTAQETSNCSHNQEVGVQCPGMLSYVMKAPKVLKPQ